MGVSNDASLDRILCDDDVRRRYVSQSKRVRENCTTEQRDTLLSTLRCNADDSKSRCIKRLLTHLHPDRHTNQPEQACGTAMYQELSEAWNELKARPNFDPTAECEGRRV